MVMGSVVHNPYLKKKRSHSSSAASSVGDNNNKFAPPQQGASSLKRPRPAHHALRQCENSGNNASLIPNSSTTRPLDESSKAAVFPKRYPDGRVLPQKPVHAMPRVQVTTAGTTTSTINRRDDATAIVLPTSYSHSPHVLPQKNAHSVSSWRQSERSSSCHKSFQPTSALTTSVRSVPATTLDRSSQHGDRNTDAIFSRGTNSSSIQQHDPSRPLPSARAYRRLLDQQQERPSPATRPHQPYSPQQCPVKESSHSTGNTTHQTGPSRIPTQPATRPTTSTSTTLSINRTTPTTVTTQAAYNNPYSKTASHTSTLSQNRAPATMTKSSHSLTATTVHPLQQPLRQSAAPTLSQNRAPTTTTNSSQSLITTTMPPQQPIRQLVPLIATALSTPTPVPTDAKPVRPAVGTSNTMQSLRPSSWQSSPQKPSNVCAGSLTLLSGEEPLPKEIDYDPSAVLPITDQYRKKLVDNAKLREPLQNGWTLFPHQKRAILKGLMKRRVILALDMGLGKTLIGCVWSMAFQKSYPNLRICVICPTTLKADWKRTAEEATGLTVMGPPGRKKKKDSAADSSAGTSPSGSMTISSWAKVPCPSTFDDDSDATVDNFVAVFDEAHSMQSMDASRTKKALTLVNDKRCVGVLLLTGTPMKNGRPANLFPLLRAVKHPLGKYQKAYETHFCQGRSVHVGQGMTRWDTRGCSNLAQLKRLINSNMLYLSKQECLPELPPLTRTFHKVPVGSRCQLRYNEAVKDLAQIRQDKSSSKDMGKHDNLIMGAQQRLRAVCSSSKIGAAVEMAKRLLETTQPSLVVFTEFVNTAKAIHEQLSTAGWSGEILTGETPQQKRQERVDRFQQGVSSIFVCTFGAGGVGLTLTAACTILLVDRPWTPGDARQAEDRIRRIGQTKPCTAIWISAFELDVQIDAMLADKLRTTNAVLTGEGAGDQGAGNHAKLDIPKLLAKVIAKAAHEM